MAMEVFPTKYFCVLPIFMVTIFFLLKNLLLSKEISTPRHCSVHTFSCCAELLIHAYTWLYNTTFDSWQKPKQFAGWLADVLMNIQPASAENLLINICFTTTPPVFQMRTNKYKAYAFWMCKICIIEKGKCPLPYLLFCNLLDLIDSD